MTDSNLADYHGVSERTIRRWRASGAPLHDESEMVLWKSGNVRTGRHSAARGELQQKESTESPAEFYEHEIAGLVNEVVALRDRLKAERPDLAAELDQIARLTEWLLEIPAL